MSPVFLRIFLPGLSLFFAITPVAFADEPAALHTARVLALREVDHGTHRVAYVRIVPPQLPALPAPPPAPPTPELTPEQLADEEALAAKSYEHLAVSVRVFYSAETGRTITELTWRTDSRTFRAWSNADFRLLAQLAQLETADRVFNWFPFVEEIDLAALAPADHPEGRALFAVADPLAHYFVEGALSEEEAQSVTLDGLDHLHAYYQMHRERLAEEHARLLAHQAELAAELARNPPRPKDTVVRFWKISTKLP